MNIIEYFKLQAKNLYKDFKTQKTYFDSNYGRNQYEYAPKFFDVDALITDFGIDENHFKLMNAQHIIANLVGFSKWTEMIDASPSALKLAKLLFDNMHKIRNEEWEYYILDVENENNVIFDDEDRLDIFKTVFADVDGHQTDGYDYRVVRNQNLSAENPIIKPTKNKIIVQISSLPLTESDRKEFIEVANMKFENILETIESTHPELVRKLWNPDQYIDEVLKTDMLPIDRDYALSLVETFLIHYVIGLATEADEHALTLN